MVNTQACYVNVTCNSFLFIHFVLRQRVL